ncbi:hypothetical protein [Nonomuraea bangladeshensis]|uniref:hypothetical protein n=1 Tax=Nonomuraea bangladeshensis TaxID=404385 RepID=UPI0031D10542
MVTGAEYAAPHGLIAHPADPAPPAEMKAARGWRRVMGGGTWVAARDGRRHVGGGA